MNISYLELIILFLLALGSLGFLKKCNRWFTGLMMIGLIISILSTIWCSFFVDHVNPSLGAYYEKETLKIIYLSLTAQLGKLLFAIGFTTMVISFRKKTKNSIT